MKNITSKSNTPIYSQYFNLVSTKGTPEYKNAPLALFGDKAICGSGDNVLVLGHAGSMKTHSIIINSILASKNAEECMVIADPGGHLHRETAHILEKSGYDVKRIEISKNGFSDNWNPLTDTIFWADCEVAAAAERFAHRFMTHFKAHDPSIDDIEFALEKALLQLAILHCHRDRGISTLPRVMIFLSKSFKDMKKEIDNVLQQSVPALLRKLKPEDMLDSLLSKAGSGADDTRKSLLKKLSFCTIPYTIELLSKYDKDRSVELDLLSGMKLVSRPEEDNGTNGLIPPSGHEPHNCAYFITCPFDDSPESVMGTMFLQMAIDSVVRLDEWGEERNGRKVHFILDEFPQYCSCLSDFTQNVHKANGVARFTVAIQSIEQMPASEQDARWYNAFQTFVFMGRYDNITDSFIMKIADTDAAVLFDELRSDNNKALVCARGICAIIGDKAFSPKYFPELLQRR